MSPAMTVWVYSIFGPFVLAIIGWIIWERGRADGIRQTKEEWRRAEESMRRHALTRALEGDMTSDEAEALKNWAIMYVTEIESEDGNEKLASDLMEQWRQARVNPP